MTSIVDDALRLACYGTPLFPCEAATKKPYTEHGFKDATCDPEKVKQWWRWWPDAVVGVPTGEASGIFVIDIDSGRHSEANDWLERRSPYLPDTRSHATRSGGWHLLFKHRHGLRNSAGKLAKGVDTRGEGGYIIWWPFHTGLNAGHRLDLPFADLPDEIFELLTRRPLTISQRAAAITRPPLPSDAKLMGVLRAIATAPSGQRNCLAFWGACRLAEMVSAGEFGRDRAEALVTAAAVRAGLPPSESLATAKSAFKSVP
jgi:Bifunctional DNA primase/polymerase, N-terminal